MTFSRECYFSQRELYALWPPFGLCEGRYGKVVSGEGKEKKGEEEKKRGEGEGKRKKIGPYR